jgi:DNA-binding protein YbaB
MDVRPGLPGGDEWIDAWLSSISEETVRTRELSQRVADVSVSASSVDGSVEVTVSSTGALTDLRLDEHVRTWPAQDIAAEILSVTREAQSRLAARVAQVTAQDGGEAPPTARAVVEDLKLRFPPANRGGHGHR